MAKAREPRRVRLLGVTGRSRSDLLRGTALQAATMLVLALPAAAQLAPNARPMGGNVVAGSAAIAQTATTTTIDQASARAAINWQSFNVGSQQAVTFNQPSANAVALNRVIGSDPSRIAGRIDANGQIVLVNQAGVTFYKGAQVNAQSLIVTSANVANADFMAGRMAFTQPGNPNARVVNRGEITVKQAGLAALVAPTVANSGTIQAKLGHVVLAGAKVATLDLYGDGLLALDVSNRVTQVPVGPHGTPVKALVTNDGVIRADGGTVQLTAAAADGLLQNLVRAGGRIAANSVGSQTGTVTLAGIGGSVEVTGLVSAAGRGPDTMGGQVAVNATGNVVLAPSARINASGRAGGGTVAIGTTLRRAKGGPGTASAMTAANVAVLKGARINANATRSGHGGTVTVLSGNVTLMDGAIAAKGGPLGGDGGFVEVSGPTLGLNGQVNVSAPVGNLGTILLDPSDLAIIPFAASTSSSIDDEFSSGTLAFAAKDGSPLPSTVFDTTIDNLGSVGNVVIQATGSIDVRAALTVLNGLTLQAGGNLTVEATDSISAGTNILLQAGAITPSGKLVVNADVTTVPSEAVTTITLMAGTGGIALNANLGASLVDLNATGGGVTQAPAVGITANTLLSSNGVTGTVGLNGSANAIANLDTFTVQPGGAAGADFQLTDTDPLVVVGAVSAASGNVFLRSSDPDGIELFLSGTVTAAGRASFQTDAFGIAARGAIGGRVNAGTFELAPNTPGGAVTLGAVPEAGLFLNSLANVTASEVRIGAVTQPGTATPTITAGGITVGGTFDALGAGLELDAKGPITDLTASPLINVATLSGTGAAWSLTDPNNTILDIGTVTSSGFVLNDNTALTIAGALSNTGNLTITDVGTLTIAGTLSSTNATLTAGNIAIPGLVSAGGVVDLIANVGTINETGTLIAGILFGSAVGVADLLGSGPSVNQVATLTTPGVIGTNIGPRNFTASSVALSDGVGLKVAGSVTATSASGQVFLESTAPAGITVAVTGSVSANTSGGTISLLTDSLAVNGAASAATIEIAPATQGDTVTLGAPGAGLSIASLTGLTAGNLVFGGVTMPNTLFTVTAGSITVAGSLTFTGVAEVTLDASAATVGASGAITQTAPLAGFQTLTGSSNSIALTNAGNSFGTVNDMTATSGDLAVLSGLAFTVSTVSAPAGNVWLSSTAAGGLTVASGVTAAGTIGVQADALNIVSLGGLTAPTFELAPNTIGGTVTLGGPGDLSLVSLTFINASTIRIGAITAPSGGLPATRAGAITIVGTFDAAGATALELDAAPLAGATGAITQSAPLINVGTLMATGTSIVLTTAGNSIAASSGMTATAGNLELVDATGIALNGAYGGDNVFLEVAVAGGGMTIGATGLATLTPATGGLVSLVADNLTANVAGSIGSAGGTVELAPFSARPVSLAGTGAAGAMLVGAGLLTDINVGTGTLTVGRFTNPGGGTTISASAISLDGAVALSGRAGTLILQANGSVAEPGGPLTVGTISGVSTGDFSLNNPGNNIQASIGIVATGGNVVLLDDPTLLLTGLHSGTNLLFEVTQPGGSIQIGTVANPATLVAASGGRISLAADGLSETAASTLTAPAGTLEVAPFSAISESVLGTSGTGQLLVDSTLLADVSGSLATIAIGEFTTPRANTTTISAANITMDGALNLTGKATTLALFANGSVSEPGGPITVTNVTGSAGGGFALTNTSNAIVQAQAITATAGDVTLVDGTSLGLAGAQAGTNIFVEVVAPGGTLQVGAGLPPDTLTAASGGRISLVADQIATNGTSVITAPAGTVEIAPVSAINASLSGSGAGQLVVGQALLSSITPGLATLTVGGFTNVPGGATTSAPSAASISIDGTTVIGALAGTLNLEAKGAVTQAAPLSAGTLTATGASVTLTNTGNQIGSGAGIDATAGSIALTDGTNLALNGAYTGTNLLFEVATPGGTLTVGGAGPATLVAGSGGRISLVADNLTANVSGDIGNAGGTVELAPFSAIPVSLAGSGSAGTMLISSALLGEINVGGGTLTVGRFTNPAGGTTTSASAISLDGAVNLAGRAGTLLLDANGPVTEPGGPLTVGTVTGASAGDFSLNNAANNIQASTGVTATGGNVVLVDDPTLLLTGLYTGTNLFFEVTHPGDDIQLGLVANPATLVASAGGRISLVGDSITEAGANTITAPAGTLELAPFSARNESVAGTNGSGQLLIDSTLVSEISSGFATLSIGEFTPPRSVGPTVTASSITVDGALNLTGHAASLLLNANGPVTEPGGPVTASSVAGSATGAFSLANPANAIAEAQTITAAGGDVTVVDGTSLSLIGAQTGDNLFIEVAKAGDTLEIGVDGVPAMLTAGSGQRITLVADNMANGGVSQGGGGMITAPSGTLELAPFSAINTSVLGTASGQLVISQPLLSIVTPGLATLTIGGFTNAPAGAATSAPSAASVSVDATTVIGPLAATLNFEATGAVTQTAPIQNVATLTGVTGMTTLSDPNNSVATLGNYTAGNGFALSDATSLAVAGNLTAGPNANLAVAGTITETGGIAAGALSGSAVGAASFTGNNTIAGLNGFTVSGANGTFTLNDTVNLTIAGTTSANRIVVSNPAAGIALGNGATIVAGGNTRPSGLTAPATLLPGNGAAGALFAAAQFSQSGRSSVTGLNGGPATVQISVTGNARFDPNGGLSANGAWLVLNLTSGVASGDVFVKALDVSYTVPGSTNLFGAIAGVTSPSAAQLGFIQPRLDPRYRFNDCEIELVSCGTQPIQPPPLVATVVYVPIDALLALVSPALVLDPDENDDLLEMPVVSKQDY